MSSLNMLSSESHSVMLYKANQNEMQFMHELSGVQDATSDAMNFMICINYKIKIPGSQKLLKEVTKGDISFVNKLK